MQSKTPPESPKGLEDLEQPVEELTPEQAEAAEGGLLGLLTFAGAAVVGGVVGAVSSPGATDTLRALRK